jgi:hypothetical protein
MTFEQLEAEVLALPKDAQVILFLCPARHAGSLESISWGKLPLCWAIS